MNIKLRLYYFGRNLIALVLQVIFILPYILIGLFICLKDVLIADGSTILSFPWEWDWLRNED